MAYKKRYNSKKRYSGNYRNYSKFQTKKKPKFSSEMKRFSFMYGVFQKGIANDKSAITESYYAGLDYPGKKRREKKPLV